MTSSSYTISGCSVFFVAFQVLFLSLALFESLSTTFKVEIQRLQQQKQCVTFWGIESESQTRDYQKVYLKV